MSAKDGKDGVLPGAEKAETAPSLIDFPTRFPIKVMGRNRAAFREAVEKVVTARIARDDLLEIREKLSGNERFLSLTITATFSEKAAIDRVYAALTSEPEVMMAL